MKSQNEEQKLTEGPGKTKKPRFTIEKLEERIAPHHRFGHDHGGAHYNYHGCRNGQHPGCQR